MKNEIILRVLSSLILLPSVFFILFWGSYYLLFFLILAFIISVYEWNNLCKNYLIKLIGIFFLFFSFLSIYLLRMKTNSELNVDFLFLVLIICISTDTGGFIFGKLLKGPKLTKISPNKTYSVVIGSFLLPLVVLIFLINFLKKDNEMLLIFQTQYVFLLFILFISIISQSGDLLISLFKRSTKKKDTGKIIPGHGGLLDRIDGMIFAFPFSFIIYEYFLI